MRACVSIYIYVKISGSITISTMSYGASVVAIGWSWNLRVCMCILLVYNEVWLFQYVIMKVKFSTFQNYEFHAIVEAVSVKFCSVPNFCVIYLRKETMGGCWLNSHCLLHSTLQFACGMLTNFISYPIDLWNSSLLLSCAYDLVYLFFSFFFSSYMFVKPLVSEVYQSLFFAI